jgi:hypothetical protein
MRHYKGYWYCTSTEANITHTLQAWCIEEAKNKLIEWALQHEYKSPIDNLFDLQIECLDGYDIVCTMTEAYNSDRQTARINYDRINHWLREKFGENIFFEWLDEDLFSIFCCVDANFDRFSFFTAELIRNTIMQSEIANLFATITLEEAICNDEM